ncbi:hypothetical protein CSKR_103080 [Clonorchis sinensis]|uniref:Uncharacterized protein n=1 Tax=Clonorchis sinensis TaxID=79923 RepID=A0A3R7JWQ6_CLOSI|nr:hypothetical protein CSKR_103080 [Clonorchis sinensis]
MYQVYFDTAAACVKAANCYPQARESLGLMAQWLELEFTDRKIRRSNPTFASRLLLSKLGQPGSIPALVLSSGGVAARHRKVVTAERIKYNNTYGVKVCGECGEFRLSHLIEDVERK